MVRWAHFYSSGPRANADELANLRQVSVPCKAGVLKRNERELMCPYADTLLSQSTSCSWPTQKDQGARKKFQASSHNVKTVDAVGRTPGTTVSSHGDCCNLKRCRRHRNWCGIET